MVTTIHRVSCLFLFSCLFALPVLAQEPARREAAADFCPALAAPTGNVVEVSTTSALINAVNTATGGDTILLADGTYSFGDGDYLRIDVPNVTIRAKSGNREAVIIDGNYNATELIQIVASNVTIADLTLREAYYHPIHVMTGGGSDTENTLIYNVHIVDPGEQAIKINPGAEGDLLTNGEVACSRIELTGTGRPHIRNSCYTGGIDGHHSFGWHIRDNFIRGFWCGTGLSEHGIHIWGDSGNTLVERNTLVDNARGIGFGLGSSGHTGGIIRNNMVHVMQDVGIGLENAPNAKVYNNTVYTENYFNSIEYRFAATSGVSIINNLTNQAIAGRDGGSGTVTTNVSNAQAGWFTDPANGDMHLVSGSIAGVIDQGQALADVTTDIDGEARPQGSGVDIGADEYRLPVPSTVTNLRVSNVVTATGVLTAALSWTPPSDALTVTLKYAAAPITTGTWDTANIFAAAILPSVAIYTGQVNPYTGGVVYFALRAQNNSGPSALSNNAFWPAKNVYLPLILRQ